MKALILFAAMFVMQSAFALGTCYEGNLEIAGCEGTVAKIGFHIENGVFNSAIANPNDAFTTCDGESYKVGETLSADRNLPLRKMKDVRCPHCDAYTNQDGKLLVMFEERNDGTLRTRINYFGSRTKVTQTNECFAKH